MSKLQNPSGKCCQHIAAIWFYTKPPMQSGTDQDPKAAQQRTLVPKTDTLKEKKKFKNHLILRAHTLKIT